MARHGADSDVRTDGQSFAALKIFSMKLIVHIGMGKAGSSTIQATLAANRAALAGEDCCYPLTGSDGVSHNELLQCFSDSIKSRLVDDEMEFDRSNYLRELDSEISQSECERVVLSSEYLFYMSERQIADLRAYFGSRFSEIVVVAYLRDPTSYYLSLQQQIVKASAQITSPADSKSSLRAGIEKYKKIFGEQLSLRPFERSQLFGECVAQDFLHNFLPDVLESARIPTISKNETLSAEAMCVMQIIRRYGWKEKNNVFDPSTQVILRILADIRRELGGQTTPKLRPNIESCLAFKHLPELKWLEETCHIVFHSAAMPDRHLEEPSNWRSTNFKDLLIVDSERVDQTFGLLVKRLSIARPRDR